VATRPVPDGGWVRALVPATSANLGPGFDALGLALDWTEEVFVRLRPSGLRVTVVGGEGEVPADETNLVVRGARAALAAAGYPDAGLEVCQSRRLPVGRGLGSSAAAVVAGLIAVNRALGEPLPRDRLIDLATAIEGHPDNVAPALCGGLCVACRVDGPDGEPHVLTVRLPPPPGVVAVVAVPDQVLETRVARQVLPEQVPFRDAVANVQRACLLVASVAAGRTELLREATGDRLHQPYRAALLPALEACLEAARSAGALGAFLSGAGPSVVALVPGGRSEEARVAEALRVALAAHGGGRVRTVGLSARGAEAHPAPAPVLRGVRPGA
jgi:homoserine kinase